MHTIVESQLECSMADSTIVMTIPFALSGADHFTIRSHLASFAELAECKAVHFVESAPCVMLAHGLLTGVVVSIGFAQTFVVPVVAGHVLRHATVSSRVGGMALTQRMQELVLHEADGTDWHALQYLINTPLVLQCFTVVAY